MQFIQRCALFVAASLVFVAAYSQSPQPVNSNKLLSDGVALYQDAKYKEAIAMFSKIPRTDSNYAYGLHNISLAYYADSNYHESNKVAMQGLKLFPDKADEWYNLVGNSLDHLGKTDEALQAYDKIIAQYNHAYMAWFNKGITYLNKKNYAEAKKNLQQSLLINPYFAPAHFFLANIAYEEGNMVPAMMGYATNLVVDANNKYNLSSTRMLNHISKVADSVERKASLRKPGNLDNFEAIQEIILSKVALDRQYKISADLEDPIVRQLHALMEKLSYNDNDKGFAMQYYVPMFERIFKDKKFEPFVNYIFSGLNIKQVDSYVKKNKREVEGIFASVNETLVNIRATQKLAVAERKNITEQVQYNNGKPYGKGKLVEEGKKTTLVGLWEFYYPNGGLKSKGRFADNGDRTGEWEFYYLDGKLKERSTYQNDKANGPSLAWFTNGNLWMKDSYKNGELDGLHTEYYYNGQLKKTLTLTDGKKNGTVKEYTSTGLLQSVENYKDDKADGVLTTYHDNGKVASTSNYVNGELEGAYKSYFLDGTLNTEGKLAKGKRDGEWKSYFYNGKISSITKYTAGDIEGEYTQYYDNGALMVKSNYIKSKLEGKYSDFDWDGKLFSESVYEKGRLREIKFFNKAGEVISNKTTRNGAANLAFYDGYGNKTIEGYFTKDGLREGPTTSYYRNGQVYSTSTYKDGLLHGEKVTYFANGNIASKVNFKDDEEHGYKIVYHQTGKVFYEGQVENGSKQGLHIEYDQLGNITSKQEYTDNDLDGFTEYFDANGKMNSQYWYYNGWLKSLKQFDTTGNVIYEAEYPTGSGPLEYKSLTGKPLTKAAYKYHYLDGAYKNFYPGGGLEFEHYYKQGVMDSINRNYFFNGKTNTEGNYVMGEREGTWKYYYENGQLFLTENYHMGYVTGKVVMYDEEGTLDKEMDYANGSLNGAYKIYGADNQLAIQLNYHNGDLISYTYEGRDGKLVPAIDVKNGSGALVAYYKNGAKSVETNFVEDKESGTRNLFFPDGKPFIQGSRLFGDDHGVKKIYFKNGTLQKEENYYYGKLHGTSKKFFADGKKRMEENYYNGNLHGQCKYYDNTGKLAESRNYYYGTLLAVTKN